MNQFLDFLEHWKTLTTLEPCPSMPTPGGVGSAKQWPVSVPRPSPTPGTAGSVTAAPGGDLCMRASP